MRVTIQGAEELIQKYIFWQGFNFARVKEKMTARKISEVLKSDDINVILKGGVVCFDNSTFWKEDRFKLTCNSDLIYDVIINLKTYYVNVDSDYSEFGGSGDYDLTVNEECKELEIREGLVIVFDVYNEGIQRVTSGGYENPPESTEKWGEPKFSGIHIIKTNEKGEDEEIEITDREEVVILSRSLKKHIYYEC